MQTTDKLQRMIERARILLAKADHPNTPKPEADLARSRAAKIIDEYRIEEEAFVSSGAGLLTPGFRMFEVWQRGQSDEFLSHFYSLGLDVAAYMDVETTVKWVNGSLYLEFVGYESDLTISDLLLTEVLGAFGANVEPKYDPAESNEENAWRLRTGGWERHRIATALYGPSETVNEQKAKNRKVTRLIEQYAARTGQDSTGLLGRNASIKTYRGSFADAFYSTISRRLRAMAQERTEVGSLVFANRRERIREALYERYPSRRPKAEVAVTSGPAPKERKKRASKPPTRAWSAAGYERGKAAARSVNLGSTGVPEKIAN